MVLSSGHYLRYDQDYMGDNSGHVWVITADLMVLSSGHYLDSYRSDCSQHDLTCYNDVDPTVLPRRTQTCDGQQGVLCGTAPCSSHAPIVLRAVLAQS